ncbi:MAG: DUF2306 domain-containing protein [Parvularculaceae bacterium]|nr:DUF2306 domain-containing protein [Parvularculaceae bacterium]
MYRNPIDPTSWPDKMFWGGVVRRFFIGIFTTLAIFVAAFFAQPEERRERILAYWGSLRIDPGFRPDVLLGTPLSVQVHVAGVATALVVGLLIFALRKGSGLHRLLGWIWVIGMATAAVTSVVMIRDFGNGVSPLHIFTVITVSSLLFGLLNIRRGNVRGHAGFMVGLFFGGLLIAGLFAFIPGRTMWQMFFGG